MSASCLSLLASVRPVLHAFLSDAEAARLMLISRATTASLLAGYCFTQHVFCPDSPASLLTTREVYERRGMRITLVCLPLHETQPLLDEASGRSLLPPSLVALAIGHVREGEQATSMFAHLASLAATGDMRAAEAKWDRSTTGYGQLQRVQPYTNSWRVTPYSMAHCGFYTLPIPLDAIPHGVRYLQLSYQFNQPLLPGVLPRSLTFLQCGHCFNQPLEDGALPEGLTHLVLGEKYATQLQPGSLPSSLQRLFLATYNLPLPIGCLPPQLQRLDTGSVFNQPLPPLALPPSLTHVKLSDRFNQPLVKGSIPEGVIHLSLGGKFNHPLHAGVLPSTLLELLLGDGFSQPLEVGSLPPRLHSLRLPHGYSRPLRSFLWPSSLRVMDLTGYVGEVAEGVLPATLHTVALHETQEAHVAIPANVGQFVEMHWDHFG